MHDILQPDGWMKPVGYANGIAARGRTIFVAGQIGWNKRAEWESDDFVDQVRQTLVNVVAVLAAAGAKPEHMTSMTWYLTDLTEYQARQKEIGIVYREICGRIFPAMAVVQVVALVEARAKVEIQAIAVVPE
jgi:enamine deaminase RidA (YjgF/YER057c/UK114 family)